MGEIENEEGQRWGTVKTMRRNRPLTATLTRVALLAGIYAVLTVFPPFSSFGYGPVQVRVAEILTVLPFLFPWAKWGLYIGCILANLASPFMVWDITLGALASLISGLLTERLPNAYLAPLPPVLVNAFIVTSYVAPLSGLSYWPVFAYIMLGQAISCYVLGLPVLLFLIKNPHLAGRLQ
ncbi:MAG TPA: QueT transporter family protein [Firmicutes bacterium]|nr:QueT transporter family protein [Candidatus Fermentithermobacillaceae bacterium]